MFSVSLHHSDKVFEQMLRCNTSDTSIISNLMNAMVSHWVSLAALTWPYYNIYRTFINSKNVETIAEI